MKMLKQPEVIGIASGKGGVGKTSISVNLARQMAQNGKRVFLFDGDMGLANAQISLGVKAKENISHVILGQKNINEIIVEVSPRFSLVPGASGVQQMAALNNIEMAGIVNVFSEIKAEFDFLIIDLAAGISPSVLTLLDACHRRVIVVADEPSSIADAYGLIKVICQRSTRTDILMIENRFKRHVTDNTPNLFNLINQVCIKFLDRSIKNLGAISEDEFFSLALKDNKALIDYAPTSNAVKDIQSIIDEIIALGPIQGMNGGLEFFIDRK
tara:strand:- start:897 stop:1706 length:810 start_codon:yes stop_codon:yes gene_type:complete